MCGFWPAISSAHHHAFILGLVREHRPAHHIAIAKTFGRFVRHWPSTSMKPRASILRPTFAAPRPSVLGMRPIEMTSLSHSSFCARPLSLVYSTRTPGLAGDDLVHLDAGVDIQALLREDLRGLLGDRLVGRAEEMPAALPAP
jgi:hypothetical protein